MDLDYKQAINERLAGWDLISIDIDEHNLKPIYDLIFKNVIDSDNESADYLFYLAIYYEYHVKDMTMAKKCYRLAIDAGSAAAMHNLASIYGDHNKYDKAEKYYKMACDRGCIESYSNLGQIYKMQYRIDLAEKYMLIGLEKGSILAANALALLYKEQEKFELAEKYFLIAIERKNNKALLFLAEMYTEQKKYDLAEKYYLIAVENSVPNAVTKLAGLYSSQKNYNLAEKYYLTAIEKGDDHAINLLANVYHQQKKYDLAVNYYHLMATKTNNSYAIFMMNSIVHEYFDVALATKIQEFLSDENQNRLTQILDYIDKNINGNFNGRLFDSMDCVVCGELATVLFMYCSHPQCIKCFQEEKTCTICKSLPVININDEMSDSDDDIYTERDDDSEKNSDSDVVQFLNPNIMKILLSHKISKWRIIAEEIPDDQLRAIYDLFYSDIIDDTNDTPIYKLYMAIYYHCQNINHDKAQEYYYKIVENYDTAVLNLGLLFELQDFPETAEHCYQSVLKKNNDNANANYLLARLYSGQNKKLSAIKYYLVAALNYHIKARHKINKILDRKFDVVLAIQAESFLDESNTQKMNKFLAYVYGLRKN